MEKIDFKKIIDIIFRKKIYITIILTFFIFLGCIYTFIFKTELYISTTTFLLGVPTAVTEEKSTEDSTTPVIRTSLRIDAQTVSTYNELVKSNSSIREIKNNLKIQIKDDLLKKAITVSRTKKSDVIEISVRYKDKQVASDIANETVNVFSKKIKEIYKISDIYVVDKAVPAKEAYNVNYAIDIIMFICLGILVSLVYCIIILLFDKTIKSQETIEELGLKVLASIPNKKSKKQYLEKLIDFKNEKSLILEGFENLKMNVQFTNINNKSNKVILVTSSFSSEGKSYVTANLAAVFAKAGKKVIIIDMDMRAGRQASIFETPNNLGISNYLSNIDTNGMEINERINSYIKETSIKNLNLITSGSVPPNPSDLLASEKLPELIKDLSVFYDLIIFDGAPVLPVPDSLLLSGMAGSTILVSLSNKTKKENLRKAKKDLQNIGARIIGVVFHEAISKDKVAKKAYSKLETFKKEKNKNKDEIKDKLLKIKKWIIEHIIFFKRKGEQLLLGQKEEFQEINNKENNKNNVAVKKELKEEIKKEESTDNIDVKENKSDNKKIIKEKIINVKENTKLILIRIKEKIKNYFDKTSISIKENFEKFKKIVSNQNVKIKEKIETKKEAKENKKKLKDEKNKVTCSQEKIENEEAKMDLKYEEKIVQDENVYEEIEKQKDEEIRLAKAIKKEQEELEKMQKREERKEQKEFLKQEKRQKRINQKKEKRKQRREKLKAKKEEIRIEEELLEDNLYPKTKHNKNL